MSIVNLSYRVLFFVFLLLPIASTAQTVSGSWEAKFIDDGESCTLTLNIGAESSVGYTYTLKKGTSVSTEEFNGYSISGNTIELFQVAENGMNFKGEINDAYDKMVGKLTLKGKVYPVTFIKTGEAKQEQQTITIDSNGQEIIIENNPADVTSEGIILSESEQGPPQKFNFRPLLVWAAFWIVISFLLWLRFKKSKQVNITEQNDLAELSEEEKATINKLLPIVRLGRRKNDKSKGLIVSDGSLIFFRKRRGKSIAVLHDRSGVEHIDDCNAVRKTFVIPDNDVENISFEKVNRMGRSRIKIMTANKTFKFTQPAYELPHLLTALRSKFGLRLQLQQPIRFHAWSLVIILAVLTLAFNIALGTNILTIEAIDGSKSWIPGDLLFSLIIMAIFPLLFFIPVILSILDHLPAGPEKIKAKKKRKDLSHGQPFRSVLASVFLKFVAIVFFFVFFLLKLYATFDSEGSKEFPQLAALPWYSLYFVLGIILSLSYSLAQRNPNKLRQKNKKKPILYLRSFADDRETTLNLKSIRSFIMGVDPPYYFLEQYNIGERTWINRISKMLIRFLFRFHPLFLLRLMFGNPKETSEQQLGKYLKRYRETW
jgi:hypothetical protein